MCISLKKNVNYCVVMFKLHTLRDREREREREK